MLVSFLRICLGLLTLYDLSLFLFLAKTDGEVSEKSEGALRDAYIKPAYVQLSAMLDKFVIWRDLSDTVK